jgi:hypothetical protein
LTPVKRRAWSSPGMVRSSSSQNRGAPPNSIWEDGDSGGACPQRATCEGQREQWEPEVRRCGPEACSLDHINVHGRLRGHFQGFAGALRRSPPVLVVRVTRDAARWSAYGDLCGQGINVPPFMNMVWPVM